MTCQHKPCFLSFLNGETSNGKLLGNDHSNRNRGGAEPSSVFALGAKSLRLQVLRAMTPPNASYMDASE
jgi:hypothetical protein